MKSAPEPLTWRDGAYLDDLEAPTVEATHDVDLDDLAGIDGPSCHSIPHLAKEAAENSTSEVLSRFKSRVLALVNNSTQTLILRIATATDPQMLWEIHLELDKRDIQPCLRWPANRDNEQMTLVTFMADMFWFTKRNQSHTAAFKGWQPLLKMTPSSEAWMTKAYWVFRSMNKGNLSRAMQRPLALTKTQCQQLMLSPTAAMYRKRQQLEPARFEDLRQTLCSAAQANRYKPKGQNIGKVADDRLTVWRVFLLSGDSPTVAAKNWILLTGEPITRQAITKQIAAIKTTLKKQAHLTGRMMPETDDDQNLVWE